jgi:hypothetical protein
MPFIAGSLLEASLNSTVFQVPADCDAKINLGGYVNKSENFLGTMGVPTANVSQELVPWSIQDLEVAIDVSNHDLEFLRKLAHSAELFPIIISLVDGSTYSGSGQIVGDIVFSTAKGTAKFSLAGPSFPGYGDPGLTPDAITIKLVPDVAFIPRFKGLP